MQSVQNLPPSSTSTHADTGTDYQRLMVYEKIRVALETAVLDFLKPYQIPAESNAQLQLFGMLDFFPTFVNSANKFTDSCCQRLVKVIRSSALSTDIRLTPTPDLAKRIRDTAFGELDGVLGSIASATKRIEATNESLIKLSERVERTEALHTMGVDEMPAAAATPDESEEEVRARLFKAKVAAFAKMMEYTKTIRKVLDSAIDYTASKCFGAEVNYEIQREQAQELKKKIEEPVALAASAFERAAHLEQSNLAEQKAQVVAQLQEKAYFDALEKVMEKKMERRLQSEKRFRTSVTIVFAVCLVLMVGVLLVVLFYSGLLSKR
jgi:hypothetical protein